MIISEITLQQHADIFEAKTDRETHQAGTETFYTGHHPELDTVILFQNGANDSATLIELNKSLPGDRD
jgi:hypothetical protein